jgi:hypothetical protein
MLKPIKRIDHSYIEELLSKYDKRVVFEKTNIVPDATDLHQKISQYVDIESISIKSVLGIDMVQYSTYGNCEQTLLPFLFKTIFDKTIRHCIKYHPYIFQKYTEEDLQSNFVSTGDGGFLILDNPLHSLIFAANFAVILRAYNSYHFYPKLRDIVGQVVMRYAMTYDKIYAYNNNYFGKGIINNSRIMSKDNLNRCLIDENTHNWFITNMDGEENLQIFTLDDVSNIYEFAQNYSIEYLKEGDEIFEESYSRKYGIINSDILQFGTIQSKQTRISIYNLHIQITLRLRDDEDPDKNRLITVSLGNLNTTGI